MPSAGRKIKQVRVNHITPLLASQEDLAMSGAVSKDCIDYLSEKIKEVEVSVENKAATLKPSPVCRRYPASAGFFR